MLLERTSLRPFNARSRRPEGPRPHGFVVTNRSTSCSSELRSGLSTCGRGGLRGRDLIITSANHPRPAIRIINAKFAARRPEWILYLSNRNPTGDNLIAVHQHVVYVQVKHHVLRARIQWPAG